MVDFTPDEYSALSDSEGLQHIGVARKSGRYPWGSGDDPFQSGTHTLVGQAAALKAKGLSDVAIAKRLNITTTQLRDARAIAKNEQMAADIAAVIRLKDERGYSNVAIAERLGLSEGTVRNYLKPSRDRDVKVLENVTDSLRRQVEDKTYLDVGSGVEHQLNITRTKLNTAVANLKREGYQTHTIQIEQVGTGKKTNVKVLTKASWADTMRNRDKIQQITEHSKNEGLDVSTPLPPMSISSKRVAVKYGKEGGADADGVIYVRRGKKDLSMGSANYAQVRVSVDGTHYLKGMAIYKDDLPDGVDLLFNTNKESTGNKLDAMKKIKDDPDNPFGAVTRQVGDRDDRGVVTKVTSVMNIVNAEGDWGNWSRTLSSQFLSKQSPTLAKQQLEETYQRKLNELNEIRSLTNPTVRQKLLKEFADGADSSAVHLKAAALPRQATQVILPVNTLPDNQIYAPNFKNGDRVALVRFPHGGRFEIPELTVNNRHPDSKKLLGQARDAVGINSKVAARLSGADFDGDTVLVIPNNQARVKSAPPLEGLKNFEPQKQYAGYEGMPKMSARTKGIQMGLVSNLITDMTIQDASAPELARAVRHSMVVIDAEKHNLNWKQSAVDNGIPALMAKYQGKATGGARTLISRAGSDTRVDERKQGYRIDPDTGQRIFTNTGKSYQDAKGNTVFRKQKVKKLDTYDDAHALSSGTLVEHVYADHSNKLKSLANEARRTFVATKSNPYSPTARKTFAKEVLELDSALRLAQQNAPLERQAQVLANAQIAQKKAANPALKEDKDALKKVKSQALIRARLQTGALKTPIEISDAQWKAIEAGAVTPTKLRQILDYAETDKIKALATPRTVTTMSPSKAALAKALHANGYTWAEVADAVGVSISTIKGSIGGEG